MDHSVWEKFFKKNVVSQFNCCWSDVCDGSERGHLSSETIETKHTKTTTVIVAVVVIGTQRSAKRLGRPAGTVVRVPGRELFGRQQRPVPRSTDVGHGDRSGHHISGGQGRHGLCDRNSVLDDVHYAGHHTVHRHAIGLRGPLSGPQAVPQRQPADGVGHDAGHRIECWRSSVRAVQRHGGRCRRSHVAA